MTSRPSWGFRAAYRFQTPLAHMTAETVVSPTASEGRSGERVRHEPRPNLACSTSLARRPREISDESAFVRGMLCSLKTPSF